MKRIFARISYMSVFMAIVAFISLFINILDMLLNLNSSLLVNFGISFVITIYLIKQKTLYIGYGPWG